MNEDEVNALREWWQRWWHLRAKSAVDPDDVLLRQAVEKQQEELSVILARMRAEIHAIPRRPTGKDR